jgi:hypothetical protein
VVLARLVFAGIATVAVMAIARVYLINSGPLPQWSAQVTSAVTIVVIGAIGGGAFVLFAWLVRVQEVSSALRMVKSKVMRS